LCVEIWHAAESRRLHIEPDRIGKLALDKLKPSDIDRLIVRLRDKGLAESTVRQIYHILRLALSGAVRDGLLARNPTGLVDRPVSPHKEARHLSPAELRSLLEAARSSRNHAVIALIAATGMRLREALALSIGRMLMSSAGRREIQLLLRRYLPRGPCEQSQGVYPDSSE